MTLIYLIICILIWAVLFHVQDNLLSSAMKNLYGELIAAEVQKYWDIMTIITIFASCVNVLFGFLVSGLLFAAFNSHLHYIWDALKLEGNENRGKIIAVLVLLVIVIVL